MIQEPWVSKGMVKGISKKGLHSAEGLVRACIWISPDIKYWPLPQYTGKDCAAVKININGTEVVVASVYMAHDLDPPGDLARGLIRFCEQSKLPLLIGSDANAHHSLGVAPI